MKSGAHEFIRRHDSDEDGKLSRRELPPRMRSDFDRLDRNQDGSVTQQEVEQHANQAMRSPRGRLSSTPTEVTFVWILDANRGEAELNELQGAYDALRKIDKNNDGKVTREELSARREQVASQWCDKCFNRLDGNHDGELSTDEAQDSTFADQFAGIDQNNDQSLTKSEIHRYLDQQFKASQSPDQARQAQSDRQSGNSSDDDDSDSSAQSASRDSSKRR
jgi:Ca2+-binding EF-hand superfamily protein